MSVPGNSEAQHKRQPTPAFLEKLFDILEDNKSYSHLIAWQPDGNSFIIKKVNEFSETVLPRYFKHSNIQSYIRQLNMYGFSKTRHDSNHHEFMHKLFQRGRRDLLSNIRRKAQQSGKADPSPRGVPSTKRITEPFHATLSGVPAHSMAIMNVNMSSEVSESSHSVDDDPEYADVPNQLNSRVTQLEEQVTTLARLYTNLMEQHNRLCDVLLAARDEERSYRARKRSMSADEVIFNTGSPQKRARPTGDLAVVSASTVSNAMVPSPPHETQYQVQVDGDSVTQLVQAFQPPQRQRSNSCSSGDVLQACRVSSSLAATDIYRIAVLSSSSAATSCCGDTISSSSNSLNLAGLEAITAAAHLLDSPEETSKLRLKFPLFSHVSSKLPSQPPHAQTLDQNQQQLVPVSTASDSSSHLSEVRREAVPGGALTKAYSVG